jgi:predicted XRE-type DNA-binding protein
MKTRKEERAGLPGSSEAISVTPSSGSVYEDFDLPDAANKKAKWMLAHRIRALIQDRGLTQVESARLLKIDQADVSRLMNGRVSNVSFDKLFTYLELLEQPVQITLPTTRTPGSRPVLSVVDG